MAIAGQLHLYQVQRICKDAKRHLASTGFDSCYVIAAIQLCNLAAVPT